MGRLRLEIWPVWLYKSQLSWIYIMLCLYDLAQLDFDKWLYLFSNYKSFSDALATSCTTVAVHVHKQTPFPAETPALLLSRKDAQFPKRTVTACHSSHAHSMKQSSSQTSLSSHAQNSPVTVDPKSPVALARTYTSPPPYNTYAKPRPRTHWSSPRVAISSLKSLAVTNGDDQALSMTAPPAGRHLPILCVMGFVLFNSGPTYITRQRFSSLNSQK